MAQTSQQPTLFGSPMPPAPEGFRCHTDFISEKEEAELIRNIETLELQPYKHEVDGVTYEGKRLVTNFGDNGVPFPDWMRIIRIRAAKWAGFQPDDLIQAHIIKYETGAPIGWHRDAPPYNAVIGISLNTPCRFQMRHRKADGSFDRFETIAEPRSIYLLSGPARSNWQHGIPPVSDLRYSITFRTK